MTNFNIVANAAIEAGILTKEAVDDIIQNKDELPIHTFKEWQKKGYYVRKGEKAKLTTDIWKRSKKKVYINEMSEEELIDKDPDTVYIEKDKGWFYKTKAFFFTADQVEAI